MRSDQQRHTKDYGESVVVVWLPCLPGGLFTHRSAEQLCLSVLFMDSQCSTEAGCLQLHCCVAQRLARCNYYVLRRLQWWYNDFLTVLPPFNKFPFILASRLHQYHRNQIHNTGNAKSMQKMSTTTPYQDAHKAFLANLTPEDRKKIGISVEKLTSAQDVIATLEHLGHQRSGKSGVPRYLNIFKELNDRLAPYFDALNTLAATNDLAAWFYGGFRLVVQVIRNKILIFIRIF